MSSGVLLDCWRKRCPLETKVKCEFAMGALIRMHVAEFALLNLHLKFHSATAAFRVVEMRAEITPSECPFCEEAHSSCSCIHCIIARSQKMKKTWLILMINTPSDYYRTDWKEKKKSSNHWTSAKQQIHVITV